MFIYIVFNQAGNVIKVFDAEQSAIDYTTDTPDFYECHVMSLAHKK